MAILIDSLWLIFFFTILNLAADLAVRNIKYIASVLKMRLFAFGILLGLVTNLPELSVGINSTIDNVADLAAGNLNGGVLVLLGLILGISLIFCRKIETEGSWKMFLPVAFVMFSPILLGIDGHYGKLDGAIMISLYLGLILYLYLVNSNSKKSYFSLIYQGKISKAVIFSIVGVVFVLLASNWVVETTLKLLKEINIGNFTMGLLVFSIGTNLPEMTIAFASWRRKTSELSLSNLLSSSFTRVLILGVLAFISPISFGVGASFWTLAIFLILILVAFTVFYHSDKKMDRREGIILLGIYVLFLITNILILRL